MPLFVGFYINQYFGIPLSVTYVCYQLESFLNRSFDTLYDFSGSVCFGFFRMQLGSFLRPQKPWHLQKTKFTPEWFFEHFWQKIISSFCHFKRLLKTSFNFAFKEIFAEGQNISFLSGKCFDAFVPKQLRKLWVLGEETSWLSLGTNTNKIYSWGFSLMFMSVHDQFF